MNKTLKLQHIQRWVTLAHEVIDSVVHHCLSQSHNKAQNMILKNISAFTLCIKGICLSRYNLVSQKLFLYVTHLQEQIGKWRECSLLT